MVLLRGSTLLSGLSGAQPRGSIGASGVVVKAPGRMTWSKKSVIISNAPFTIEKPTRAQATQRVRFGQAGATAKGRSGLDPATGLPQGAVATMTQARGPTGVPGGPYARRSFHTIEQLQAMTQRGPAPAGRRAF